MASKPVFAAIMLAGAAGALYLASAKFGDERIEREQNLAESAAEGGNFSLPMMLDAETRLDSMTALSADTFEYKYTLVNLQTSQINRHAFEERVIPHLQDVVCTDDGTEAFRSNGVHVVYTYRGNDGGEVASIVISAGECASAV